MGCISRTSLSVISTSGVYKVRRSSSTVHLGLSTSRTDSARSRRTSSTVAKQHNISVHVPRKWHHRHYKRRWFRRPLSIPEQLMTLIKTPFDRKWYLGKMTVNWKVDSGMTLSLFAMTLAIFWLAVSWRLVLYKRLGAWESISVNVFGKD